MTGLHRLRSALARLQAEVELLELDGTTVTSLQDGLHHAFGVLESLESQVLPAVAVVLEDEERLGALTVRGLGRAGLPAVLATSIMPALELIRCGAVLVADLSVLEAATAEQRRLIRESRPIIVSGASGEAARLASQELDARAYFLKPADPAKIAAAVRSTRPAGAP